jgi:ATP-dependent DNA helicase RecG
MQLDKYTNGESKNVEFKVALPDRSIKYTKTAVAFANGEGGSIVFGIADKTLDVVGIDNSNVFTIMDAISNAIADSCEPLIIPDISLQDVDGKTVIVAQIAPGHQRPYFIKSMGLEHGVFVRVAGTTREADASTVKELMFEGSNRSFDQAVCPGLTATAGDIETLCAAMTATAEANAREGSEPVKPVTASQLLSWGVLAERDGRLTPTNAYAILTGNEAIRSVVQCGVFKGSTKATFVDCREYRGTPKELIEQAYQFVLRNIHMGARFNGVYRQDVYEIPPDAIRELIVNSIVHRSYIDRRAIQIAVYDNRLEITSPGRLPFGQTVERMKQGYSKIRNEALAAAFSYMRLIEHWGSGIPRIIEEVHEAGLDEPEFINSDIDLRINIYRKTDDKPQADSLLMPDTTGKVPDTTGKVPDTTGKVPDTYLHLKKQQKQVYEELIKKGQATSTDIQRLLGVKDRRARIVMKELIDLGLVRREGSSQSTRYVPIPFESERNNEHE